MSHPNPLPNKNWPPPALNWVSLPPWQTTMFSHLTCCACSWAHWQRRKLLSCLTIFFTGTKSHYTLSYKEAVMSLMCSHTCMDFLSKGEIVGVLRCCSGSILQLEVSIDKAEIQPLREWKDWKFSTGITKKCIDTNLFFFFPSPSVWALTTCNI